MKSMLGIMLVILSSGCITGNIAGSAIFVESGDHVFVHYTGTLDDGTVFDSSEGKDPLEFDAGAGQMIKGFDDAVIGMSIGEEKTVKIASSDAYGAYDSNMIVAVARTQAPEAKIGDILYSSGRPVKVLGVSDDTLTIDFNHHLAGKDLTFKITMADIKKRD